MNLLTISRMKAHLDCRRKDFLRYEQGWRAVRQKEALRVGGMIHAGLEAWWKWDLDRTEEPEYPQSRLGAAYAAIVGKAQDEPDRIKAEEILRGYDLRWGADRERVPVIAVEQEFRAPLLHPETLEPSQTWLLAGKLDAVQQPDVIQLVEHKTTSEEIASDADGYWRRLPMDGQLSMYVIGSEAIGHPPEECLYDVIRKPESRFRKATPEEKRKFTKKGELYANQRDHDETPDEFRTRLREEIEGNLDSYYRRKAVPRLNSEIQSFMADAWAVARSIHDARRLNLWPRNPDACFRFGSLCEFFDHCANGLDLATSAEFVRLENPHAELKGEPDNERESVTE